MVETRRELDPEQIMKNSVIPTMSPTSRIEISVAFFDSAACAQISASSNGVGVPDGSEMVTPYPGGLYYITLFRKFPFQFWQVKVLIQAYFLITSYESESMRPG